ncbi:MAG: hypothetical protein IPK00_10175 [Deltaproteobacteria bacterium]|nr:hypothetical protein [Deltaproteobacteria bacterium]
MAVTIAPLTTGGRTPAGSGKTAIAASATETVYTHVSTNTDACATVINSFPNGGGPDHACRSYRQHRDLDLVAGTAGRALP